MFYKKPSLFCMNSNKSLDCLNGSGATDTDNCQGGGSFSVASSCYDGAYTVMTCNVGSQAGDYCISGTTKNSGQCSSGSSAT